MFQRTLSILFAVSIIYSKISHYECKNYTNYKLYRITPTNQEALQILKELENNDPSLNFWTSPQEETVPVEVVVPPNEEQRLFEIINPAGVEVSLISDNIQKLIDRSSSVPASRALLRAGEFDWISYHTLEEIYSWLQMLAQTYPGNVTLLNAGKTYQGRDILGVKVSFNASNANRSIFFESNIHANEWITSAVSTYILNEFLTSTNETIRSVAEEHDWYFFPVFNPDGFVYTHTTDRLWRKTRVPHNVFCIGSDPNRNWNYLWMNGGASKNPCSNIYAGPRQFSEPSVAALATFISSVATHLMGYIGFHSYSQLLLLSYGHTTDNLDNFSELYMVGIEAMRVLAERYNTTYKVGNIASTIYIASGSSMDWVKGTHRVPLTYTYELRDTGEYGFLLPPEQIIPTALETLDSIISILWQWGALHPEYYV